MSQDCDTMPKSRKHHSTSKPMIKQNRKSFWRVSESSSFSSNGNSPAQSNDECYYLSQSQIKNIKEEEKDEMIKKLQCQVKELRHKLRILEDCIETKDCAVGTVTREKDRIMGEIRRLERSNKQLRQQLNDERNHYMEEKEKFCEEMAKFKKRLQEMKMTGDNRYLRNPISVTSKINSGIWQKGDCAEVNPTINTSGNILSCDSEFRKSTSASGIALYQGQDLSLQMAALRTENAKLKSIITDREERNYELCLRFLRMKCSKNDLRNRFQDLEQEYLQVITNLMEKIDEARDEFNFIIDQKFKKPLHSTNANYIRMVQKNSKMAQENITLRMEIQSMKKQLSKGNIGQGDCGSRKPDEPKKSSSDNIPKNNNKITGIKQMKSEGSLPPKASDTDSNYMSKTPTTDPSTTTIGGKSSESTIESMNVKSKTPKPKNKLFSDDILQKIFELVDTQSNSGIHSESEEKNSTLQKLGIRHRKLMGQKDLNDNSSEGTGKRYVECTLNAKKFHEIPIQRTLKKSATTSKEKIESSLTERHIEKKTSDEIRKPRKKISDPTVKSKNKSLHNMSKEHILLFMDNDILAEKENISLKGSSRFKVEKDRVYQFGNQRQYKSRKERHQKIFLSDYCGLEENLETDEDTSPDNDSETPFRKPQTGKYNNQLAMLKHRLSDKMHGKISHEIQTKENDTNSDDSAIGSSGVKVKNRNSISLHDELMEATKSQSQTDDPFWRRELNLHSLITKKSTASSKTYRLTAKKSQFISRRNKTSYVMDEDEGENVNEIGVGTRIDDDESRSVSPLWRNKAGSEKEMTLNMTDKTTNGNPLVMTDSEVVLHFLMPPATILSAQSFLYDESCKESSLPSGKGQKSPSNSVRQLMNPASNVPSSCTTMELTESTVARENGLTSRTLSAPALIESEWFNNFKMCEMKDCSTNT